MSLTQFRLPDVGEGLTDADVTTWYIAVGDEVAVDQDLCEIETAKSAVDLPSPVAGTVREILVPAGTNVAVGTPLVTIETAGADAQSPGAAGGPATAAAEVTGPEGGDDAEETPKLLVGYGVREAPPRRARKPRETPGPAAKAAPRPETPRPAAKAAPGAAAGAERFGAAVLAKPPVRRLARDLGIDLGAVPGTGPGGIITREDVLAHQQASDARELATYRGDPWLEGGTVSADGRRTRVPAKSVRKRTAEAMVHSAFTAPHVTEFHTVDVTRTMELVAKLKEDKEFRDLHVTPLLVVLKALLIAVKRHPEINAAWDDEAQEIVYKHYVNLGIAAATPRGLVVPNIKDAHRKSLVELATELGDLTRRARAGKITPAEMTDGTITVTNVGAFGIETGTPILNPGESAILAFGAVNQRPWVHEGEIAVRWVTRLALSFDHRLVDGVLGSVVLADLARILEEPGQALVWD